MIITKQFFLDNSTENKAWTSAQVKILGLDFPLKAGWQNKLIGKEISDEEAKKFGEARFVFAKKTKKKKPVCNCCFCKYLSSLKSYSQD
jgi:hypothetical protein